MVHEVGDGNPHGVDTAGAHVVGVAADTGVDLEEHVPAGVLGVALDVEVGKAVVADPGEHAGGALPQLGHLLGDHGDGVAKHGGGMVAQKHVGRGKQGRLAPAVDVERDGVGVGVVAADELLHQHVGGAAGGAQRREDLVELGLGLDEVDLLEALRDELVVLRRAGGLHDDGEVDLGRRDGVGTCQVRDLGAGRLEPVARAQLGEPHLVGDEVDDVHGGNRQHDVVGQLRGDLGQNRDQRIGVRDHEDGLGRALAGDVAQRGQDLLAGKALHRVLLEDGGVRDGTDGRRRDAIALDAEGLVHLAAERVGADVAADDDGLQVVADTHGRIRHAKHPSNAGDGQLATAAQQRGYRTRLGNAQQHGAAVGHEHRGNAAHHAGDDALDDAQVLARMAHV